MRQFYVSFDDGIGVQRIYSEAETEASAIAQATAEIIALELEDGSSIQRAVEYVAACDVWTEEV